MTICFWLDRKPECKAKNWPKCQKKAVGGGTYRGSRLTVRPTLIRCCALLMLVAAHRLRDPIKLLDDLDMASNSLTRANLAEAVYEQVGLSGKRVPRLLKVCWITLVTR